MNELTEQKLTALLEGLRCPDPAGTIKAFGVNAMRELGRCIADKADGFDPGDLDVMCRIVAAHAIDDIPPPPHEAQEQEG